MNRLQQLARKQWTFGGTGSFVEPPFWSRDPLSYASPLLGDREAIETNFQGYCSGAYKRNGIVFACILARLMVMSEARFMYQQMNNGKPGDLVHGAGLDLLERPWPNGTTGELLARMEQDVSLSGNFFATTVGGDRRIRRLSPERVTILTGIPGETDANPFDLDARVIGYLYNRAKYNGGNGDPVLLTPDQVVHFSPIPDPEAQWRGMSWITPVVREIESDSAATKHKLKFFEQGATINFAVAYDANLTEEQFKWAVRAFKEQHDGVDNAYKTLHLGGGADVKPVGSSLQQLDFKATQGAGETRIAAASGVGAIVAQFSEGMQGSSLNAGNYGAARRRFADMTVRPWWRMAAASLEKFTSPPPDTRLWFDADGISFLQEDAKDAAEIKQIEATTIGLLIREGYTAESAQAAVLAGNWSLLDHSGLVSVQLQRPGEVPALPA